MNRSGKFYSDMDNSVMSYDDNEEDDYSNMGAGTDQSMLQASNFSGVPDNTGAKPATWQDNLTGAAKAFAAYKLEAQRNRINIELAKQGKPLIDTGATVSVGLSSDTKKLIYVGIGAIALMVLLPKLLKG